MKRFLIYHELAATPDNPNFAGKVEKFWYGKAGVTQTHRSVTNEKYINRLAEEHGFASEKTAQNYIERYRDVFEYDDKRYWTTTALKVISVEI